MPCEIGGGLILGVVGGYTLDRLGWIKGGDEIQAGINFD